MPTSSCRSPYETMRVAKEARFEVGQETMTADLPLWLAGIGIALAVPVTFMVANWVRKNVDHGEMRFGPDGKVIDNSGQVDADLRGDER